MELEVSAWTDRGGGAGPFRGIGSFLLPDDESFGTAVQSIAITLKCPAIAEPERWQSEIAHELDLGDLPQEDDGSETALWDMLRAEYERGRHLLPEVVFRRTRGHADITVASEINYPMPSHDDHELIAEFGQAVAETIAALELLRGRFSESDDFDLDGLLARCDQARRRLPQTSGELNDVLERERIDSLERWQGRTDWETLEIDWEDFHPSARELLDDPFFWDVADDDAPHGNDTGADFLAMFGDELAVDPHLDTCAWTRKLLHEWDASGDSDYASLTADEAWVAAAFADLKLRGRTAPDVATAALESVARLRARLTDEPADEERDSRLAKLVPPLMS